MRDARFRIKRLVPPLSWRDDKLAAQAKKITRLRTRLDRAESRADAAERALTAAEQSLATGRAALERPSFHRALLDLRRTVVSLRAIEPRGRHPLQQLPAKLPNYRFAASHGVATPDIHAAWATAPEIDVAGLPDQFVLKSDGGAGGNGVFPLYRTDDGALAVVNTERVVDLPTIKDEFLTRRSLVPPFFSEELLVDRSGASIPADIKVYAFYGQIGHVHLRRPQEHGNLNRTYSKFVDEEGRDLGDAVTTTGLDPDLPLPDAMDTILEVSRHLSRAVGVPFVRVDLYETDRGIVLGELTRGPGGRHTFSPEHDAFLGSLLEEARWRLERDVVLGRPPGRLHGRHPAPQLYPPGPVRDRLAPVAMADCEEWCSP